MAITKEILNKELYALAKEAVFETLETDHEGLKEEEIRKRKGLFGLNVLPEKQRLTSASIFLNQFKNPLILILLGAGFITLFLNEFGNAAAIFAATAVNTLLGFYQENKAEEALRKLKTYLVERTVVIRQGKEQEIDTQELVPGDILRLRQGSRVPADARVIFANNLYVDESILTGESLPEGKREPAVAYGTTLADRTSMIYSGSLVTEGFCQAAVTATGALTEIGKIASAVAKKEREKTPLQRTIEKFSRTFGIFVFSAATLLFVFGLFSGYSAHDMFLVTVAVAVSAVPEGLPVALTVVLAVGVQRLAGRRGIIRRLLAAETLGSASVVLTDKTGTLTEAKMDVTGIINYGASDDLILKIAVVNTDVIIENPQDDFTKWEIVGTRPLETSLVMAAAKLGVFKPKAHEELKPVDVQPFNSRRKFSAAFMTLRQKPIVGLMGAPEVLLFGSRSVMENNKAIALSKEQREDISEEIDQLAHSGKRILGVAIKELESLDAGLKNTDKLSRDLIFLGLITLSDPVRASAKESVRKMQDAGVRVVMITGDHRGTAESVAKELGFDHGGEVIEGEELEMMSPEALDAKLDTTYLYARASPDAKLKVLNAYQARGEVVAMTGDGINDAPTLKKADIGIALGSGTDVAKDVSDLILLDDNFSTIVAAIEEGRKIFENVRKSIAYLLVSSFTELILVAGSLFAGIPLALDALAIQILWINIFADSVPAVSLAFEKERENIMRRPPSGRGRKLLDKEMKIIIFIVGLLTDCMIFLGVALLARAGVPTDLLMTLIFTTLGTVSIMYIFPIRSLGQSILKTNPFSNAYLNIGVLIGLLMMIAAIYTPFLNAVLHIIPLPLMYWPFIISLGLIDIVLIEIVKYAFAKEERSFGRVSSRARQPNR
ncbi:MAG: hypothetical protein A2939_03950 [Parcubacteria group bacterium RIFCSPLOWO2_01_FULL_48_18]|nr:MAG: hypothetical protein A2939_03950 [Parcubacteria group bacterium RIFCSPLOWO2_01_FULL_48_18]